MQILTTTQSERLEFILKQQDDVIRVRNRTIELLKEALAQEQEAVIQEKARSFQIYRRCETMTANQNFAVWLAIVGWVAFVIALAAGGK